MTSSRLLESLLAQARSTRDRNTWARAICRTAAHQARSGRIDAALASLAQVRQAYGPGLHPEVLTWLMLSEGILHWCRYDYRQSHGRMLRAHAVAVAMDNHDAVAACAAWLGWLNFEIGDVAKMPSYLDQAFRLARPDDHHARARAAVTLAMSLHLADSYESARPWYEECRRHATSEGDETTISAMLYNVAAIRLALVRLDDAFGIRREDELFRASLEVASSGNYDAMIGMAIHPEINRLLKLNLQVVQRDFTGALQSALDLDVERTQISRFHLMKEVDRAWCTLNVGDLAGAEEIARAVLPSFEYVEDADDRAYILARASMIFRSIGDEDLATKLWNSATEAQSAHHRFQVDLRESLAGIAAQTTK